MTDRNTSSSVARAQPAFTVWADQLPVIILWITTLALTGVALVCIAQHTHNIPLSEDWHMVPPLTGHEPHFWEWLWAQNNEHRTPLPRLVQLSLLEGSHDFRIAIVGNVLIAVATVVMLVFALQRARAGKAHYSDIFVPLAFLHLGHWENLGWSWQICFVLATAFTCVLLVQLMSAQFWESSTAAAVTGGSIAALPLCGANGMVIVFPAAAWLALGAICRLRRMSTHQMPACLILAGTGIAAAASTYYFVGYQRATWNPPSPGLSATLQTALKFLALGLGPAAGWSWRLSSVAVTALLAAAAVLVVRAAWCDGSFARDRALGLLAFGSGLLALALAVGFGRAGLVPVTGMPARYALLAAPSFVWAYIVAELYGPGRLRTVLQVTILIMFCAALPLNIKLGRIAFDWSDTGMRRVEADIRAGVPHSVLVQRHQQFLMHWSRERLSADMLMLREARIGPFAQLRLDPPGTQPTSSAASTRPPD